MNNEFQPFLKWAGGKRQIINELTSRMPKEYNTLFEPFVGAGALFMNIKHSKLVINDINSELMNTFIQIKKNPYKLIKELDKTQELHKDGQKEFYLEIRAQDREKNWNRKSKIKRASRLMYLNKYCFNGLYRVNKSGYYNVPFNGKEFVSLYNKNNIMNLSKYLRNNIVSIFSIDFEEVCSKAQKGDFIYFDPPYDVIKKDTFDSYNENGFGVNGQIRLSEVFKDLDSRGCYVMLSNHRSPLIEKLYSGFNVDIIKAKRMINSNGKGRGEIEEVIIRNY